MKGLKLQQGDQKIVIIYVPRMKEIFIEDYLELQVMDVLYADDHRTECYK